MYNDLADSNSVTDKIGKTILLRDITKIVTEIVLTVTVFGLE